MNSLREIKNKFKSFVRFKKLREESFRPFERCGNNLLYLKRDLDLNINDSGIENLGTDWMLEDMGRGNFKFSRRWAWLYRHYTWASRAASEEARNVVDIGCDVGEMRKIISRSFYSKNPYYLGVDLDAGRLDKGAQKIQMRTPAMYVHHDVTTKMNFIKSNSVDVIFAGEVIEHFEKKFGKLLLREIYRILKPGGLALISTPNADNSKGYEFHVYEYGIKELVYMSVEAGFCLEKKWGWVTTEKSIKKLASQETKEIYFTLAANISKDLIVPFIAYLEPEVSDGFCIEVRKPLS